MLNLLRLASMVAKPHNINNIIKDYRWWMGGYPEKVLLFSFEMERTLQLPFLPDLIQMGSFELEQSLEARTVVLPTLLTLHPQINTRGHLSPVLIMWKTDPLNGNVTAFLNYYFFESAIWNMLWIFSTQNFSDSERKPAEHGLCSEGWHSWKNKVKTSQKRSNMIIQGGTESQTDRQRQSQKERQRWTET